MYINEKGPALSSEPDSPGPAWGGPEQEYVPLFFRSYFSLLRSCLSPEEICRYARSQGYKAVGVADVNNVYGLVRFIRAARNEGLKPVAGVVVAIEGKELFTAYITNRQGFGRLNRLLTWLNAKTAQQQNRHRPLDAFPVTEEQLMAMPAACSRLSGSCLPAAGAGSGGPGGLLPGEAARLEQELIRLLAAGGWEGLWLVSSNLHLLDTLSRQSKTNLYVPLLYGKKDFSRLIYAARSRGLPLLALNLVLYLQEEAGVYHLLRAIDRNQVVEELPPAERLTAEERAACRPATRTELAAFYSAVPEALTHTARLAAAAQTEELLSREFVFPRFPGYGEASSINNPAAGLTEPEAYRLLKSLCLKGVTKRYGRLTPAIRERLHYELNIIQKKHFAGYFLVVHDIVCRCPRTCGRGSSAASLVSYLLSITHVDPLQYNLFFERFLNMGRSDPPDIDIDFPWDEREHVFAYVFKKYRGRAGLVANHVTLGPRAALRETAKALGVRAEEIGSLVGFWRINREEQIPSYVRKMADRIRGFPQYLGVHCGGVVITPGPITDHTPLQLSVQGYPVIAWEKEATEEAGLVKIDLLGNRSLGVLRDTIELVAARDAGRVPAGIHWSAPASCDWSGFSPLDDRGTQQLIRSGQTLGIFYVESPATRQLLKKMKEGDFERLVIASSIIRPAANKYIKEFVERLHGKPFEPLHPTLAETLQETYGIMVYQEDVSRVAIALAGFSAAEADRLRKIIAKKDRERSLADFKQRFFAGGAANGVGEKALAEAWEMILSFTGYSFCKAHSASYALVSYKLAYFKRYYPLEFMVSVINNRGGFYSCQTYLNESRRLGIAVLGPDINFSEYLYTPVYLPELPDIPEKNSRRPWQRSGTPVCPSVPPGNPLPGRPAIRIGLCQLRELHRDFIEKVLRERSANGLFSGFGDFVKRCRPGLPELRLLIRSGALDSLAAGYTRPELFWLYFNIGQFTDLFLMPPIPRAIGDYSQLTKWQDEVKILGLAYTEHPLIIYKERIRSLRPRLPPYPFITARDIPLYQGQRVILAGLVVTGKEVFTSKKEQMLFLSFEDPAAIYETVLFPQAFRRYYPLLDKGKIFLLAGRVEEELGALSVNIEELVLVAAGESENRGTRLADYGFIGTLN